MKVLCRIGKHKWGKAISHYLGGSNVKDWEKKCLSCGKVKKWVEPVKDTGDCC